MYEVWHRDPQHGVVHRHYEVFTLREDAELKAQELEHRFNVEYNVSRVKENEDA